MQPNERLSALMDDAGDASDREFLRQTTEDPTLHRTWSRYHAIRQTLRDPGSNPIDSRFSANLTNRLALDPPHSATVVPFPVRAARSKLRTILPIAASLVGIAVLGILISRDIPEPPTLAAGYNSRAIADLPNLATEIPVLSDGEYQRRLNAYLVNFNEQRAQLRSPGVHPYVRVVDFESGAAP
ncbi:MAG: sigma-E factor negative regulatory protein [Gammaproteobacteria bacterium]